MCLLAGKDGPYTRDVFVFSRTMLETSQLRANRRGLNLFVCGFVKRCFLLARPPKMVGGGTLSNEMARFAKGQRIVDHDVRDVTEGEEN